MDKKRGVREKVRKGTRFGSLKMIDSTSFSKGHRAMWLMKCDCGVEKKFDATNVRAGATKSCGCVYKKTIKSTEKVVYRDYISGAKSRSLEFKLSFNQFIKIAKEKCMYCGAPPRKRKHSYSNLEIELNGVDRIDNSLGYISSNCAPCCKTCNRMKHAMGANKFLDHIRKIYNNQILQRMGDIMFELEDVISKMVEQHDLQKGEILGFVNGYIDIHFPDAVEIYQDDTSPKYFYGAPELHARLYKKESK